MNIKKLSGIAMTALAGALTSPPPLPAAVPVLTYHNDNARSGANTNETLLTLDSVNTNTFGLLVKYPVDGYVYAQPLYVPGLVIPGRGTHNAVFVATENDSVYAFDADIANIANTGAGADGGLLWHASLGDGIDIVTNHEFGGRYHDNVFQDMLPRVGITGTPVIDPATGTLFVDAFTRAATETATNYHHTLHALNITNGTEQPFGPVEVTASVPGVGVGSSGGVIKFEPRQHLQRAALTLAGGILFVAFGSAADTDVYHGWIMGYNATNLQPLTNYVFNTTPNATPDDFGPHAGEGALWMSGNGLCVDADNNLYFEVANGSFDADPSLGGGVDYGDSFMKLSTANHQLTVADYFTPSKQAVMQADDADFGSGGALLLPDETGSAGHPHLIVGGDKDGRIYLVDRDHMGRYDPAGDQQIVEEFGAGAGRFYCSPAYFNHQLYYQGQGGVMKAFAVSNAAINRRPISESRMNFSGFGTTPSVSANGTENGIVWAIQSDGAVRHTPAILHAYNATNLAIELYNSSQLPRDNPGNAVKMTVPTVADGKVFVGAQYALAVFGVGDFPPAPVLAPNGGDFINSVTVTLADNESGATIYYTLDGTTPTAESRRYTGPITLTKTAELQAIALKPGAVSSGVSSATFVNTAAVGGGSGLLAQYWAGAGSDSALAAPPTLIQTNAIVDFDWSATAPDQPVGQDQFTHGAMRWTGALQAQYDGTYDLAVVARGLVRLSVNGRLLIDDWAGQSRTVAQPVAPLVTNRSSITLRAQQLYNLQLDYWQDHGGSIQLAWKRSASAFTAIPRTQLYPFTNPPPAMTAVTPENDAGYTASASVTFGVDARTQHNEITKVEFFANGNLLGALDHSLYAPVYALTATGIEAGRYTLTAVATDGSGLSSTSAPVTITVTAGGGKPYGMTTRENMTAFLHLPATYSDALPPLLSGTGVYSNTASRTPAEGLIPYALNAPMWDDGAAKSYYLAVPRGGSVITPDQQVRLRATNSWKFPDGSVFVKNLDLIVDETNPQAPRRRLETQILVRDINGAVYGAAYKWRPDNRDADLLTAGVNEDILITNATGVRTQTWYFASPADCLTCHTPLAGYVLGLSTRQLNGNFTYPATGRTDNQIRTLNRLGLFSPAINDARIANFPKATGLADEQAPLADRVRSYLDANCAHCHRPGGVGNFDARLDTPAADQHIVDAPAAITLGLANARIISPGDVEHSVLYQRLISAAPTVKMPPVAHNEVDARAARVISDWIKSLPATPAR
jgi:uncharacterized repeat protein (TIGR03806 family)